MPLTPESLAEIMGNRMGIEGYRRLFPTMNAAMLAAGCTSVERAAGWHSQLAAESGGLRWFTELGEGCVNYEWRDDLGNNQEGDGCRFRGRGPIQVTGRSHYTNLSQWAFDRHLVPTATFFVDDPDQLASTEYGFIGAVWYWLTHMRPDDEDGISKGGNQYCDERDIVGLTKWVNGGTRALDQRIAVWNKALEMGEDITPAGGLAPPPRPSITAEPDWHGDPVFLPDLLRSFGVEVSEYPGWLDRGHGDFGAIWGIVWHHTGNINETDDGIAHHPVLGLAANMLIHPDGHVVLTGVGVAWHAGEGIYPGIPEDNANSFTIGIECVYGPDPGTTNQFTTPWPEAQVTAMIKVGAAITWFLGFPAEHNIAHKEWAGADNPLGINKQGKPDPANFNMAWFRDQIRVRATAGPGNEEDDMFTDDDRNKMNQIWSAMFEPDTESDSPYDTVDGTRHSLQNLTKYTNASADALAVETGAAMGNVHDLLRVKEAADRGVERAVACWSRLPQAAKKLVSGQG